MWKKKLFSPLKRLPVKKVNNLSKAKECHIAALALCLRVDILLLFVVPKTIESAVMVRLSAFDGDGMFIFNQMEKTSRRVENVDD